MQLPRPGDILEGKYQLEDMLGQGAYGLVVKARTLSTNRPVAVKIMKPSKKGFTDRREQRFMRELRVIAKLQCPNTLTLYDFGKTDAGVLFMVTEYVEGEDLFELLERRGTISETDALHVLHQCLLSLSEAHELGVLHRDIKPHNIRLTTYGDDALRVKVLDFGLSKTLEDEDSSTLTAAGVAVGTPRYMSPEQLGGHELTPASDIYSLGLVVYEMVHARPERPDGSIASRRSLQLPNDARFTPGFRTLVNRMLQRPLPERYKTAAEVLAAVKAVRAGETPAPPATASPFRAHTGGYEAIRTGSHRAVSAETGPPRPPTRYVVALAALALAIGAGAYVLFSEDEPPPVIRRPVQPVSMMNPLEESLTEPEDEVLPVVDLGPTTGFFDGKCEGLEELGPGIREFTRLAGITQERALVYVPAGYDPTKPHGLVWVFHDYSFKGEEFIQWMATQLATVDVKEQYIVLAPTSHGQTTWRGGSEFEAALAGLDIARQNLCIDPNKIFAWSHGFGGRATMKSVMCMPDIAAVATSAYRVRDERGVCEPASGPKPYLHIAATNDDIAPLKGGRGCIYPAPHVDKQITFFRNRNGCEGDHKRLPEMREGECREWDCRVPFRDCRAFGGRVLPGMEVSKRSPVIPMCAPQPSGFPYVKTIWEFFRENARTSEDEPSR